MKFNSATKLCIYLGVLSILAATIMPGAESVSWVVGMQSQGDTGPFIGQYDQFLVGNPRTVAYGFGFDLSNDLGGICSGPWNPFAIIGNPQPGNFDFNCVATADEITANTNNVGFYVGGLNHNGVTTALCYVTTIAPQLCDSDTLDKTTKACTSYLECQ